MNAHDAVRHKRQMFRKLLKQKKLTVMPGGFSPLYVRLAQQAGFECFFLAGSQLSSFLYGVPDNGIIGLRELVDHARQMAMRSDIPILVDADTGFGNAVNVYYAVQEIVQSGVASMSLEDQEAPKKSGDRRGAALHLDRGGGRQASGGGGRARRVRSGIRDLRALSTYWARKAAISTRRSSARSPISRRAAPTTSGSIRSRHARI